MSEESGNDGDVVTLEVTVPRRLLAELDELASASNYANRSEFVREVLRDVTEPTLTPGAREGISQGYADASAGRTTSISDARERIGIEVDGEE